MSKKMLKLADRLERQSKLRCLGFDTRELLQQAAAALRASAVAEPVAWQDDPAADERWNAGVDFVMKLLCDYLCVEHSSVTWDAATETVEGDVSAVIGNILRAKFGDDWGPHAHPAPAAPVPASVFDRLDAFFTETRPYGYAKDNSAIEQFLVKARTALASLPAPAAAPTREETIEQCAKIASNQARIPDNTPERRAHIYCATTIADAILALKAAPAK